jgi:hypothetical protein
MVRIRVAAVRLTIFMSVPQEDVQIPADVTALVADIPFPSHVKARRHPLGDAGALSVNAA